MQDATTKLSSAAISALLKDRAPLLRDRGPPPKRLRGHDTLLPDHVVRNPMHLCRTIWHRQAMADQEVWGLEALSVLPPRCPLSCAVDVTCDVNSPLQAVQSGAAAESLLFWPALGDALAPELYAPFRAAMGSAPTGMPPPPPRLAKRSAQDAEPPQVMIRLVRRAFRSQVFTQCCFNFAVCSAVLMAPISS